MGNRRRAIWAATACLALAAESATPAGAQQSDPKDQERRPRITLRAQPPVGVAPSRVILTAELIGGANDFEDYYCPTVVWEWGDDTTSESTIDCEPYEAGKTAIKRRFTVEHIFRRSGTYKVFFRLKRREKAVGAATTNVQIQPGAREFLQ